MTNKAEKPTSTDVTLPSGAVAKVAPFKGRHIREAQKQADGDSSLIMFALIAQLVEIDGKKVVAEDVDDMDGRDVMKLMELFSGAAGF